MACGRPVIALGRGGATETVRPGVTGWLVDEPTDEAFAEAMREAERTVFDPTTVAAHAASFSTDRFETGLAAILAGAGHEVAAC
jgi:glycosyltransferase involved in cell wall biosynthesis